MFYQTELKLQSWRALAVFDDGSECLLYLGRSTTQVRGGYLAALEEMLDPGERARVRCITLQCWQGAADQGCWISKSELPLPAGKPAARDHDSADPRLQLLRFPGAEAATDTPPTSRSKKKAISH